MNPLRFIHGYTPADLQNMGMTARSFRRRSTDRPSTLECASPLPLSAQIVNPEPLNLNGTPSPLAGLEPVGKRRKEFAKGEDPKGRVSGRERVIGLGEGESPASSIEEPASDSSALTPPQVENPKSKIANTEGALTPLRELRASVVKSSINRRKARSKASQLPPNIRLNLNTMLANGHSYREAIGWLDTQGYPGFNKVNLNAWKKTGFQDWLRFRQDEVTT